MKKPFFLFVFALFSFSLLGQPADTLKNSALDLSKVEQKFMQFGKTILTDSLVDNRKKASQSLATELIATLKKEGSFSYPFDSLQTISIQYPADSSFRIFTWQLYVDVNEYQYVGLIQINGAKPKVIRLNDKSLDMEDDMLDFEIMTADNWYGALYYNIMSFDTPEGTRHLLFGFDGFQFFNKRKIIDVLTLENGNAVFGAAVFAPLDERRTDLIKNRVMVQYAAGSNVTMNFKKELEMIVFDNLIPHSNMGGQPSFVPDGSYRGYQLKNGLWVYKDKIFDHVYETAPTPAPVLGNGKKVDIFGRKQKE